MALTKKETRIQSTKDLRRSHKALYNAKLREQHFKLQRERGRTAARSQRYAPSSEALNPDESNIELLEPIDIGSWPESYKLVGGRRNVLRWERVVPEVYDPWDGYGCRTSEDTSYGWWETDGAGHQSWAY
jgi:hypothetical protein